MLAVTNADAKKKCVGQQEHALRMRLDLAALYGEPNKSHRRRSIRRTIGRSRPAA
jgi:hypothetical protein